MRPWSSACSDTPRPSPHPASTRRSSSPARGTGWPTTTPTPCVTPTARAPSAGHRTRPRRRPTTDHPPPTAAPSPRSPSPPGRPRPMIGSPGAHGDHRRAQRPSLHLDVRVAVVAHLVVAARLLVGALEQHPDPTAEDRVGGHVEPSVAVDVDP